METKLSNVYCALVILFNLIFSSSQTTEIGKYNLYVFLKISKDNVVHFFVLKIIVSILLKC